MNNYNPICAPNQIICGTGQTIVVTGWTLKEAIAKKLDSSQYAAIGQLYCAARGINYIVRNLLANPHVNCAVLLSATTSDDNAKAVECLSDFFNFGVTLGFDDKGDKCWIVNSSVPGYVNIEIPLEAIDRLRRRIVNYPIANSIESAIRCVKDAKKLASVPSDPPLFFPSPSPPVAKLLPGPRYGHRIEGANIAEVWLEILRRIRQTGTLRPNGYDGQWQELIDLMAIITDEPENFYFPEPNYLSCDRAFVQNYISQILDDAPYRKGVKYTYGQRLRSWFGRDQIEQVIDKLVKEIDSASAVMSLWDSGSGSWESLNWSSELDCDGHSRIHPGTERFGRKPGDSDHDCSGSPCLNHLWVRVVENELSLTATFRSNDMFAAWPANAFGLRALQKYVRDAIAQRSQFDLKMGPLITVSQSAHIYDNCFAYADKLLKTAKQPASNFKDAVGNFIIETLDSKIVVLQTDLPPKDVSVNRYQGTSAYALTKKICFDNPAITPSHAAYLGIELHKAEVAIALNKRYCQDKSLNY